MKTPIIDFVTRYEESGAARFHMPGHKGRDGVQKYDITEITGADNLYQANGIIAESERNAGELFGAETFYSAEGSSQAIRAMLYLAVCAAAKAGTKPRILAGRNAHKTFIAGAALLDIEVEWLVPRGSSYLSCPVDEAAVEAALSEADPCPTAVYLTCPDYLGHLLPLEKIAAVCHRYGALLLVDNAHGAYLKFLPRSLHPMDRGADLCADSAHKTLSVLTGGAYLHLSPNAPRYLVGEARAALALFGSTSPSYLILASLDRANALLAGEYRQKFAATLTRAGDLKRRLQTKGYRFVGEEPMKLTLEAKAYGYTGGDLAAKLEERGIGVEFADPDFLVLMPSTDTEDEEWERLEHALAAIPQKAPIQTPPPAFALPRRVLSPRAALFSDKETLPVEQAEGRVLAQVGVTCPPAVPVAVCGERIDRAAIRAFLYYGITHCSVVK